MAGGVLGWLACRPMAARHHLSQAAIGPLADSSHNSQILQLEFGRAFLQSMAAEVATKRSTLLSAAPVSGQSPKIPQIARKALPRAFWELFSRAEFGRTRRPAFGRSLPNLADFGPIFVALGPKLPELGPKLADICQFELKAAQLGRTRHLVEISTIVADFIATGPNWAECWSSSVGIWPNSDQTWPRLGRARPGQTRSDFVRFHFESGLSAWSHSGGRPLDPSVPTDRPTDEVHACQ